MEKIECVECKELFIGVLYKEDTCKACLKKIMSNPDMEYVECLECEELFWEPVETKNYRCNTCIKNSNNDSVCPECLSKKLMNEIDLLQKRSKADWDLYSLFSKTKGEKLTIRMNELEALYDCQDKEDKEKMPIIQNIITLYKQI